MSEALYERYKDALRRGHVAALRGRYDVALDAYGEASRLAPDRALPFVGIAGVLTRLGRAPDALAAYEAALDRAPGDEAALRGRAELLAAAGDRIGAATTLDRLAAVLDANGRLAEATDAARRALELAESRGRRVTMRQLAERLRAEASADPAAAEALAAAMRLLAGPAVTVPSEASLGGLADDGIVDAATIPAPVAPPTPPAPPFFPGAATAAVEDAADGDDPAATRARALEAAAGHRAAGSNVAAIDACYIALATNPSDAELHLALADLYLDRGWRTVAADKLVLLARLAELAGDRDTRERVCEVAAARLPEESRLAAVCA